MNFRQKMAFGLSAIALVAGVSVGQPAQANDLERIINGLRYGQGYDGYYHYRNRDYSFDASRLSARISNRLQNGLASGRLTRREYNRLSADLNAAMADRYRMDPVGFRNRLVTLDSRINYELNDPEIAGRRDRRWY